MFVDCWYFQCQLKYSIFFISELRAMVQDGCKDFGDNLGTEEDCQFLSRSFDVSHLSNFDPSTLHPPLLPCIFHTPSHSIHHAYSHLIHSSKQTSIFQTFHPLTCTPVLLLFIPPTVHPLAFILSPVYFPSSQCNHI